MNRTIAIFVLTLLVILPTAVIADDNFHIEENIWTFHPDGSRTASYKEIVFNQNSEKVTGGSVFTKAVSGEKPKIDSWTDLEGRKIKYSSESKPRGYDFFYEYPVPIDKGEFGGFIVEGPPLEHQDFFRVGDVAVFSPGHFSPGSNTLFIFKLRLPKDVRIIKLTPEQFTINQAGDYIELSFRRFFKKSERTQAIHCEFVPGEQALNALKSMKDEFHIQKQVLHLNADLSAEFHVQSSIRNNSDKPMEDFCFRSSYDTLIEAKDEQGRTLKVTKIDHPDGNGYLYTVYLIDPVKSGKATFYTSIHRADNVVFRWGKEKVCIIKGPHTPIPATNFVLKIVVPKGTKLTYSLLESVTVQEETDQTIILFEKHLGYYEGILLAVVLDIPEVKAEDLEKLSRAEENLMHKVTHQYTY